ncbi:MAG: ImmA/IrrE family metallo-endopeptidase [Bacteroidetes bacterium]|nr:ImmA/IrrE family metallo-endopeptidase [Bacteroidota bacterium]
MIESEKINPKMLTLAREARGYSQADLAEKSGVSRSNISRFEQDNLQMSSELLNKIMGVLKFQDSLFYADTEILPSALYRRRDTVPAKRLMQIDANINIYQMNIARLLSAMKKEAMEIPSLPLFETRTPEAAAIKLRKLWKLNKGAIENLTQVLEEHGFITIAMDFDTERVDSRSILIEDKFPVIFYNKKLLGDRLRFTLAYELGHIVMHTRTSLITFTDLSKEANSFAAEFLMPKEDILKDLSANVDLDLLARLKGKWKASMHALLYRAVELEMITENQKRYLINQFNALKIRRREPKELDLIIERGKLLRDLITKYRTNQKMSMSEMAAFFHLHEAEFLDRYN